MPKNDKMSVADLPIRTLVGGILGASVAVLFTPKQNEISQLADDICIFTTNRLD